MKSNKLKQPTKYAHSSLLESTPLDEPSALKTKPITKQRKTIRKPNEPSALRLAAIN